MVAGGEHVDHRDLGVGGQLLEPGVVTRAHPDGRHVPGEHQRGVADRLAPRQLHVLGPQDHGVAAELGDAALERDPRAGARAEEQKRHRAPGQQGIGQRGALARLGVAQQRLELGRRELGSGEKVTGHLRVLTWNLYHGRAVPPAGRDLRDAFAAALAGWAWDVAVLQEVPPWWPRALAAAARADWRQALTSRNLGSPLRRRLAEQRPDVLKSGGGGANAILVRRPYAIAEHRTAFLRLWPERRGLLSGPPAGGGGGGDVPAPGRPPPPATGGGDRAARGAPRGGGAGRR